MSVDKMLIDIFVMVMYDCYYSYDSRRNKDMLLALT